MSKQKLWGGRFSADSSALLEEFNASITFDKRLWSYDILGSKAHAKMLCKIGVLSKDECEQIIQGLESIATQIAQGRFCFEIADEDIHMSIEKALINQIGEVGKKLHTARSRNDQVALDFRMFVLDANRAIKDEILALINALLEIASRHTQTLLAGMTHLQHAQVVNLGFHIVAWVASLKRDIERLDSAYKAADFMPLGSGALAGTPYKNDREFLASELGFSAPTLNAMDSVSDRDFALDLLYGIAMLSMHISRIAEEMVLWSSAEFGWLRLSDEYATGSSIMPQKKNPDVPELLRGKSGRAYGNLISLLVVMKSLPLAYNKDTQEDKEAVFDSVDNALISLKILREALKSAEFDTTKMANACKVGHLSATDLADFLVRECALPFREAHHITGNIVAYAESKGIDISELSQNELENLLKNANIKDIKQVKDTLELTRSMHSRDTLGGSSPSQTKAQIATLKSWLQSTQKETYKYKGQI
ncbi:argininosuccinate lyase [Helicobacter sp. T3_23-1059]